MDSLTTPLGILAQKSLNRVEYIIFSGLLKKIELIASAMQRHSESSTEIEETKEYRYSHDIDMNIIFKIFKNNQKGEQVELHKYEEFPILIKCPLGTDPEVEIALIKSKILNK